MSHININESPMCIHCLKRIDKCKCKLDKWPGLLRREVKVKTSINMCQNKKCPARFTCYRFMKKPDNYQFYKDREPADSRDCDYFIPVWKNFTD